MKRAVCPGSFDPITFGHLDIIERASNQFDEVIVAVFVNRKKSGLFTIQERMEMIQVNVEKYKNVRVDTGDGLLVEYCKKNSVQAIVKGLRAVTDFDYELQMAQMNSTLGVDTFFVATNPEFSFLSSSLIKEVAKFNGDVSGLVPEVVQQALSSKFSAEA